MRQKNHISKIRVGILIFFLFPFRCFSQDISGVWTGRLYNDTTKEYIPFEIAINESGGKASGFSHSTFFSDNLKYIGVKAIKIKIRNDKVFVEDDKFIYNDFATPPPKGVKMYSFLTLSNGDSTEILSGNWKTNATRTYRPLTGTVFLERKKKHPEETTIVKKLIDLGLSDQLSFLPPLQYIASKNSNESLAATQKTKEDPARKLQEQEAIARAQTARKDSTRKLQEQEAIARAQTAREDSIRKLQEQEAIAMVQQARKDSISKVQRQGALAKQHAQQAKEELARQQLKQEELAKAQKAKEEFAPQQQDQKELAKAANAKEELARRQKAEEELVKVRKANPTAAAEISKRKLETIRTVEITEDSLVFSLYDNGTVDGDTVSVLLNGQVIMPRVGLLVTAISKTIYLTPEMGDSISVVLYAENLGSIPPNTGLLVIHDGPKIYEIRFSGDLSKNSKIILIRKKKT
jgi:hypothetical protein